MDDPSTAVAQPQPIRQPAARKVAVKSSDFFDAYGRRWDRREGDNEFNVELKYYSRREEGSGFSTEYHFRRAWAYMWPKFEWNEWSDTLVWAWCNYSIIAVIGHTRSSKSFTLAYIALLDYLSDASRTATTFTTTKFDALRTRIWGDLLNALETTQYKDIFLQISKLTNTSNELKFMLRDDKLDANRYIIQGIATDSSDETASKIRGQHADRRRIIADEAEDMGAPIYTAIANARSAPDFKAALLTNPAEKQSEFGSRWACPKNGWGSVRENDLYWDTVQPGGICVHFDGLQSPNMKSGKTVFPYLLTQKYIDDTRISEGENSLKWWMFVRGFPPPDGLIGRIWPANNIEKAKQKVEFDFEPAPCAALDPAFDGDDCVIIFGLMGRIRGGKPCCYATESHKINTRTGATELPKDYQIAREVMRLCKERGVAPENFCQDETGNARGVLAILRVEWSPRVQGISYGGEATERPLRLNDPLKACEQVRYFVAELWFRASYMAQAGLLCGLGNLDQKTEQDLSARRYVLKQHGDRKLMVAETKEELKKRLGRSPDYGDAFSQLGELMVRKGMLEGTGMENRTSGWDHYRKLARKAARRFSTEAGIHGETW